MADLHTIMERGPAWNCLVRCIVTLNRDDGDDWNEGASLTYSRVLSH